MKGVGKQMFKIILILMIVPLKVIAANDITSNITCLCECSMTLSICECPTAVQLKNEVILMKENGFSENQIFKVLQTEYGMEILAPDNTSNTLLWVVIFTLLILAFLGYLATKKPNSDIPVSNKKQHEQRFEEEYHKFVSEMEEV